MPRNQALDSLRGLAALAVALGHCVLAVTGLEVWRATLRDLPAMEAGAVLARLAYVAFPSDAAVIVFFVLSGHVLWGACARHPGGLLSGLPDWILARAYRLFPVAAASAIPLGLLQDASASRLVENMLLLRYDLNGPAWSLQVEVVASILIFLVHRAVRGTTKGLGIALGLSVLLLPLLRGSVGIYVPAFLAGALLGAVPPRAWRPWLLVPGLACLLLPSLVFGHGGIARVGETLGAVVLVGTLGHRRPRWLLAPGLLFLGRISYPFYLSHTLGLTLATPLVAASGVTALGGRVLAFAVLSIGIALPVAWLLHVGVEAPAMAARPRWRPAAGPAAERLCRR